MLLNERDDAREQLARALWRADVSKSENQAHVTQLQKRLDSETQRLVAESAKLCAQLEHASVTAAHQAPDDQVCRECMYVWVYVCVYVCICIYICVGIQIYTYI